YYYLASYRRKPVSNTRKRNENKQQEMDSGLRRNDAYLFWLTTFKVRRDLGIIITVLLRLLRVMMSIKHCFPREFSTFLVGEIIQEK
ncbi:MAG: hypothetical protein WBK91_10360, partial [Alphaproteobacteria bacterium]